VLSDSHGREIIIIAPCNHYEGRVTFRYKDYRHDAQQKTMILEAEEFIRRFLLHVLPEGFQCIRY